MDLSKLIYQTLRLLTFKILFAQPVPAETCGTCCGNSYSLREPRKPADLLREFVQPAGTTQTCGPAAGILAEIATFQLQESRVFPLKSAGRLREFVQPVGTSGYMENFLADARNANFHYRTSRNSRSSSATFLELLKMSQICVKNDPKMPIETRLNEKFQLVHNVFRTLTRTLKTLFVPRDEKISPRVVSKMSKKLIFLRNSAHSDPKNPKILVPNALFERFGTKFCCFLHKKVLKCKG